MGWLMEWGYRKSHIINSAPNAGINYQKKIIIHFGAGIDADEDVYLDGKCRIDFGDIRFTDYTGITLLDYWIEEEVDSNHAIFWVEISEDLTYDRKIYIYYDNPIETSLSNGSNTFILFDDFETDLSKWSLKQGASISTDYAYSGSKCLKLEVVAGVSGFVSKLLPSYNVAIHIHYYDLESAEKECHMLSVSDGSGHDSAVGVISDISQYEYIPTNNIIINSEILRIVGWHKLLIKCTSNSLTEPWLGGLREFFIDGILMPETCLFYANIFLITASNGGTQQPNSTGKAYYDLVFLRKFVSPEPAHSTWGEEELAGEGITTFEAEDVGKDILSGPLDLESSVSDAMQKALTSESVVSQLELTLLPFPPVPSEDVIKYLQTLRTYKIEKEFIEPKIIYPIIGGRHIIQTEGEIE